MPHIVHYGGRRRKCLSCNRSFRIRSKKRGRKVKRERTTFAQKILRLGASLRGVANIAGVAKSKPTRRFHRSILAWKRTHLPAEPFTETDDLLILIIDGIFFSLNNEEYVCLMILVRPVNDENARLRGLIVMKGDESKEHWEEALEKSLTPMEESQVKGIVADGSHGLVSLCKERGWIYQRCHFHLLKELRNICRGLKGSSKELRKEIFDLMKVVLNTPDEMKRKSLIVKLSSLITHPDCPRSLRNKVNGFLMFQKRFFACYLYPELNLPKTSNSAECVGQLIRMVMTRIRGLRTLESLKYWLDIILRSHRMVQCHGFKNTPKK